MHQTNTPIDTIAYMTRFLPAIDKIRFARSCRTFLESAKMAMAISGAYAYDPNDPEAFVLACQDAEEHFIDLHLRRGYATSLLAMMYCAKYGHLRLVKKYMALIFAPYDDDDSFNPDEENYGIAFTSAANFALRQGRGDIFVAISNKYSVLAYDCLGNLMPVASNKCAYDTIKSDSRRGVVHILDAVEHCILNPYVAIFFDPDLETQIMALQDRVNTDSEESDGPVSLEDEIAFAYLIRDEVWIAQLKKQMTKEHTHTTKILRAAVMTGHGKMVADVVEFCHKWDIVSCTDIVSNDVVPVLCHMIKREHDTHNDDLVEFEFCNVDPLVLGRLFELLIDEYRTDQAMLNIIMTSAFSHMIVETIDELRNNHHVPLPTPPANFPATFHYVHPRMLEYMDQAGMSLNVIQMVLDHSRHHHLTPFISGLVNSCE